MEEISSAWRATFRFICYREGHTIKCKIRLAIMSARCVPGGAEDSDPSRTGAAKSFKKMPQRILHLLIGIQRDSLQRIINQTHRQRYLQFAPLSLTQDPAAQ